MGLLDKFKSMLQSTKLDIKARFDFLHEESSGTMSQFYKVRDFQNGKIVGLKILDTQKAAAFAARFPGIDRPSEGEIASSLDNEYIVKTLEYGLTTKDEQYIVMEFVEGHMLSSLIVAKNIFLDGNRIRLIRQMTEAIQAVHEAGYIHRDICPRNFICSKDVTSLKLIDFGLSVPATKDFMSPGNRTGTPHYMAPEIVRRRSTDQRVDLFALGVSAYQLCAMELPWPSEDHTGKAALLHDTLAPVDILHYRPQLNKTLAKAITACLSASAENRPQTAETFLRMIQSVENDDQS